MRRGDRPTEPRIAPLGVEELDENQSDAMALVGDMGRTTNIFTTLVRHPGLFRRWAPFGGKLLSGRLPARDRELMILRVGWRCRAEYEWAQHVPIGRAAGLSDDEIERVKRRSGRRGLERFGCDVAPGRRRAEGRQLHR